VDQDREAAAGVVAERLDGHVRAAPQQARRHGQDHAVARAQAAQRHEHQADQRGQTHIQRQRARVVVGVRRVGGALQRGGQEGQPGRGQRDADPLAPRHGVAEQPGGEHRQQHEAARDHRLHHRDRRERQGGDVEAPRRRRHHAAEQVDGLAEQVDRRAQRVAHVDVGRLHRAAMLEQEADDRHARRDDRHDDAELDGERHGRTG